MNVSIQRILTRGRADIDTVSEKPKQILSMQAMPSGCYVVSHVEADAENPESISSIDSVLFMAVCLFEKVDGPVVCYGIQNYEFGIDWKDEALVEMYCYGPYKQSCELIGETPTPFLDWYKVRKQCGSDFDIALEEINSEAVSM